MNLISATDVTGGCTRRRAATDGKGSDDDRGQIAGGNRALTIQSWELLGSRVGFDLACRLFWKH